MIRFTFAHATIASFLVILSYSAFTSGLEHSVFIGPTGNHTTIQDGLLSVLSLIPNDTAENVEVTLNLENGETFSGIGNTNLNLTVFTWNKLIIQGSVDSPAIIDCNNASRFFYINQPSVNNQSVKWIDIVLSNVIVTDCYPGAVNVTNPLQNSHGGAIYAFSNYTTLAIENVSFTYSKAGINGRGGALALIGPRSSNGMYMYGGPIILYLTRVRFVRNMAGLNGLAGALYVVDGDVSMTDVEFDENYSSNSGGALFFTRVSEVYPWTDVQFRNNYCNDFGGAAYMQYGGIKVIDVLFDNNTAASGGAVSLDSASLNCTNCQWLNNYSEGSGGALEIGGGGITARGGAFQNNKAGINGGIYVSSGVVRLTNVSVTGNSVGSYGGGFYIVSNSDLQLTDCVVTNNNAQKGGAIFLQYRSTAVITNTIISNNDAVQQGGAIYCSASEVTLTSTSIDSNEAPESPELHCSYEVGGTYCKVDGDSSLAGICKELEEDGGLNQQAVIIIALLTSVVGIVLLTSCLAFVIYFSDKNHRRQQGLLFNRIADEDEMNPKDTSVI